MFSLTKIAQPPRRLFQRAATWPPVVRFALGILRHPAQARLRLRELSRILRAPGVSRPVTSHGPPPQVEVVPVTGLDAVGQELVGIYARNPSPFVSGPATLDELAVALAAGVRYFLVLNAAGAAVGVRGFDPKSKRLLSAVTDFPYRGQGYHLVAAAKVRATLAREGHREFRSAVLRSNTRMRRAMTAAGWHLSPDPVNRNLLRGTLLVRPEQT